MSTPSSSLQSRYEAVEAERRRTWSPEALAGNIAQREALVRAQPETTHVKAGDVLSPHTLLDAEGTAVSLDDLTSAGAAVLVFFRFAGCPACNIALPYYAETLVPVLKTAAIPVVAVSSQPFPELDSIRTRNDLPFPVLNDPELTLSHDLGITYLFDEAAREAAISKGSRSEALNGTSRWELPKPTVLVLNPGRVVRFIDISPDWMRRTETSTILKVLGLEHKGVSHAA